MEGNEELLVTNVKGMEIIQNIIMTSMENMVQAWKIGLGLINQQPKHVKIVRYPGGCGCRRRGGSRVRGQLDRSC